MTATALTVALHGVAFADGGAGGGLGGGAGGTGYTGANGADATDPSYLHAGGGGGAPGDIAGGIGGTGGPGTGGGAPGAGGKGGGGGLNNQNGGSLGNGGDGDPGGVGPPGGGGSGGGGGGGGAGFHYTNSILDLLAAAGSATIKGGNGGAAGKGWANGGAGGKGGDGGAGLLMGNNDSVTVNVTSVTGGNGGRGGDGASAGNPGVAGKGGDGGAGIIAAASGSVTINSGVVTGGNGGNGGNGGPGNPGTGGNGGNGGAGVAITGTGTVTVAAGTSVGGGKGGAVGATGSSGTPTTGAGGAGIKASGGVSVTVAGSVSGGMNGTNAVRAHAVDFTNGGNTLTLQNGYAFTGNVVSDGSGAGDTLALGGSTNGSFNLAQLGVAFQGFSALKKTGAGTWTVTGTSTFAGATTVSAGELALQGASLPNSPVSVSSGATLSATGNSGVKSLDVFGTLSLGDSSARLGSGNVSFESGSTFLATMDVGGGSGQVQSTGTAQLNGVVKVAGTVSSGFNYVILTAATVSGNFAGAQMASGSAFIIPTLHYDVGGEVYLTFTTASFASVARFANQRGVSSAIDAQTSGGPLATQLSSLTADQARAAYDSLSGAPYASAQTAMLDDSHIVRDAMEDRLLAPSGDGTHLWGKLVGDWNSVNGNGNAAGFSSRSSGVLVGTDGTVGGWRIGALAGYGREAFGEPATNASAGIASYSAGVYAATNAGGLQIRAGAGVTHSDLAMTRAVAFGTVSQTLAGNYGANLGQVFAELGYKLDLGGGSIEPFGNLTKIVLRTGSATETGGTAALNVGSATDDIMLATLGLHASMGTGPLSAHATIGWQHSFAGTPRNNMAFQSGGSFTVDGVPLAPDAAVVEADLALTLAAGASLHLSYTGQLGIGTIRQSANATLNVAF